MSSLFQLVFEEFEGELLAIDTLVKASSNPTFSSPKARVAGANAATLLLAATFEEFIREVARVYARVVVEGCKSFNDLPPKLAPTLWKRTMEMLARIRLNPNEHIFSEESVFSDALSRFTATYEFCRGDLSKDIYKDLIHNDANMRPQQINALLNISGLKNVCGLACAENAIMLFLGESEGRKASARFVELLEDFFERRNKVAHSIGAMSSNGPEQISNDMNLLRNFGRALCDTLGRD